MDDWRREITTLCLVKQRLAEVNEGRQPKWPFHNPETPATSEQLQSVEGFLGFPLDPLYRAFLLHANGWAGFFQKNDLFGTADLIAGAWHEKAIYLLMSIESLNEITGYEKSQLLPISVSQFDIDVFVLTKQSSKSPGKVLWLAGGLIDTFLNFDEFYLAMIDYNRREVQRFEGTLAPGA